MHQPAHQPKTDASAELKRRAQPDAPATSNEIAVDVTGIPAMAAPQFAIPPTPQQVISLQSQVGNQVVRRMLAKRQAHAAPTANAAGAFSHLLHTDSRRSVVQRVTYKDLNSIGKEKYREDDPILLAILKQVTEWENAGSSSAEIAFRQEKGPDLINDFFVSNYEDIRDGNGAAILKTLLDSLPDMLAKTVYDPYQIVADELFAKDKFHANAFDGLVPSLSGLDLQQQMKLLRKMLPYVNLYLNEYIIDFDKVMAHPPSLLTLFRELLNFGDFAGLPNPSEYTDKFFGGAKTAVIELAQDTAPRLLLLIEPGIFINNDVVDVALLKRVFKRPVLDNIFDLLSQAKMRPEQRRVALLDLANFLVHANDPQDNVLQAMAGILTSITTVRNPAVKPYLYNALLALLQTGTVNVIDAGINKTVNLVSTVEQSAVKTRPIWLLLGQMYPACLSLQEPKTKVSTFLNHHYFVDSRNINLVLKSLMALNSSVQPAVAMTILQGFFRDAVPLIEKPKKQRRKAETESSTEKESMLEETEEAKTPAWNPKEAIENFGYIATFIQMGHVNTLANLSSYANLGNEIKKMFGSTLNLKDDKLTSDNFEILLQKFRNVNDLIVYASALKNIKDTGQRERTLKQFRDFVLAVMQDPDNSAYKKFRYGEAEGQEKEPEKWKHLSTVLELPQVREEWKKGAAAEFVSSQKKWVIVDTDDPSDMLRLGEDVQSCTKFSGSAQECSMSYLIDGKNRAIIIKAQNPQNWKDRIIVARAVFKILTDGRGNVALFVEKSYFSPGSGIDENEANNRILMMAQQRAKAIAQHMKIKPQLLVSTMESYRLSGKNYSGTLKSLGGPAEFDYNDSALEAGPSAYEIPGSLMIPLPYD
jgi:hypothetical protein